MSPGISDHDPKTVAALTDLSLSKWHIFETVKPPLEKALSTSVEEAKNILSNDERLIRNHLPGADMKSSAIRASGCPVASIADHHAIGSLAVEIGGDANQSVIGSPSEMTPKVSSSAKYLPAVLDVSVDVYADVTYIYK